MNMEIHNILFMKSPLRGHSQLKTSVPQRSKSAPYRTEKDHIWLSFLVLKRSLDFSCIMLSRIPEMQCLQYLDATNQKTAESG